MIQNRIEIPDPFRVDHDRLKAVVDTRSWLDLPTSIWRSYRDKWFSMYSREDIDYWPGFSAFGEQLDPNVTVMYTSINAEHGSVSLNRYDSEEVLRQKISGLFLKLIRSNGWAPYHKEDIDLFEREIT